MKHHTIDNVECCTNCGEPFEMATSAGAGGRAPKTGDLAVCAICCALHRYVRDGDTITRVAVSDDSLDPATLAEVNRHREVARRAVAAVKSEEHVKCPSCGRWWLDPSGSYEYPGSLCDSGECFCLTCDAGDLCDVHEQPDPREDERWRRHWRRCAT